MLPEKILALFSFIDFLDERRSEYIEKYIPLCDELNKLDNERSKLNPKNNYIDKQKYDDVQKIIKEKFQPLNENVHIPILARLRNLGIWSGEDLYTSIWNNNASAIYEFRENFSSEDIENVMSYKQKYLRFRSETNSGFLGLQFVFNNLDEIYKALFDYFKDTTENEFIDFEARTIEVENMDELTKGIMSNKGNNVRFTLPQYNLIGTNQGTTKYQPHHIYNEIIMGDKYQLGDISNNSGQIIVGKNNNISDSFIDKQETVDKIDRLLTLVNQEKNITDEQKQRLIADFSKVKEELSENVPSKSKISEWLTNTRSIIEPIILSHELSEAINWFYTKIDFLVS